MKKEHKQLLLDGMFEIVELLNFYNCISEDSAQKVVESKSSRKTTKKTQELISSEVAISSIITTLNFLGPFLVSQGLNIGQMNDSKQYVLVKDGYVIEPTEESIDKMLDDMIKELEGNG